MLNNDMKQLYTLGKESWHMKLVTVAKNEILDVKLKKIITFLKKVINDHSK